MEAEDIRFFWAAYKKGSLAHMRPEFASPDLTTSEFRQLFEDSVVSQHDTAWTIFAETSKGVIPVGMALGAWAPVAAYLVITGIAWFPWATKRNIIEGTVAFFSALRKQMPWIGYAKPNAKRLYEVCCMHGIMRRIGTSHIVFPGEPAAVFEAKV